MEKNLFKEISIKVAFTIKEVEIPRKIPNKEDIRTFTAPDLVKLGCF